MGVIEIIERARPLSWAYIDCGFGQGREALLRHLQQNSHYINGPNDSLDLLISRMQNDIVDLMRRSQPYDIPADYIYFLENYGGLLIDGIRCNFSILGLGPMVETWYGYVNTADNVVMESGRLGWLSLGGLVFRAGHTYDFQRVEFFMDLAGHVQKNSVIGLGPWDGTTPAETMLKQLRARTDMWRKLANSFAEWLSQAFKTRGGFGYQ